MTESVYDFNPRIVQYTLEEEARSSAGLKLGKPYGSGYIVTISAENVDVCYSRGIENCPHCVFNAMCPAKVG